MRKPNKRETERDASRRSGWTEFRKRLGSAQGFAEAEAIVRDAPPVNHPARSYYSNLAVFLEAFSVPGNANQDEIALYIELLERIEAAEQLKAGEFKPLRSALEAAASDGNPPRFRR